MKNLGCLVLVVASLSFFVMGYAKEQENSLKEAEILLNSGNSLLEERSYKDALQAYDDAWKIYKRKNSLLAKESYKDALQAYDDAWKIYERRNEEIKRMDKEISEKISEKISRGTEWAIFGIGVAEYHLKNYETARKELGKILKDIDRKFSDFYKDSARFLIARSYLEQENKDYAQAYIAFDRLTTRESKDYAQEHLDSVKALLDFHPSNFQEEAMYKTAYCSKQLGRYEEALALYMDFRTRFPESEYVLDAYFDIGEIYLELKHYDLALTSYDLALKSADDHNPHLSISKAKIQNAIGFTHYKKEDFEEALAAYNKLWEKYEESEEIIKEDKEVKDEVINALYKIAHIYGKEKKWDEVIKEYRRLLRRLLENKIDDYMDITYNEGLPDKLSIEVNIIALSYFEIGHAYRKKENFEEAFKKYERIIREPDLRTDPLAPDLRTDPLAPFALFFAMSMFNKFWDEEELRSDVKEERWSDVKEEFDREKELESLAGKYIKYISDHSEGKPFLAAEAQLQFAHIQLELEQYDKAATEYAKLQDYKPSYTRLNLIKLRGKYYEGLCYKNDNNPEWKEAYKEVTMLFELNFQPFIDFPNIDIPDVENRDYYISTALRYVGLANEELKEAEDAKGKIEEIRQESGDKIDNKMDSSDASGFYDSPEKAQTQQLTAQDIAEIAKGSTVFIETEKRMGSGFFVSPDQIVTNFHVIKDAVEATARLVGTEKKYAIVGYTALDADRDLAILKVRTFGVKPLKLGDSEHVEQGTEAYPIGNPLGLVVNVVSDGKISSIQWVESIRKFFEDGSISDRQQNEVRQKLLVMTAPISPGNSGGPVLNDEGEVIGISVGVFIKGQNLNLAIPVNDLKALLKMVGPPKPLSNLDPIY